MKTKAKLPGIIALTGILAFSITACAYNTEEEEDRIENPYLGATLSISGQQVWKRNVYAAKLSQSHVPYYGDHDIDAYVYMTNDGENYYTKDLIPQGEGKINNGILSFTVPEPDANLHLLEWQHFVSSCFSFWDYVHSRDINVKGNMLLLYAYTGSNPIDPLDRERFTSTSSSITCETILYIYVNKDCVITGDPKEAVRDGFYLYSSERLYLPLKKGWNMVSRKETYGVHLSGIATISMKVNQIKNPESYRWVMQDVQ